MTGEEVQSEREIFQQAVRLPAEERGPFLKQACGADDALHREVESLLEAHDAASNFMAHPAIGDDATALHQPFIAERPGTIIGPYKLLQQIGEGGMGVVFMAEQRRPVRRRVAIKIIKPGMDTRQVIARFEAEQQALAMMDHPNIAKVLDAGTTAEPQARGGDRERERKGDSEGGLYIGSPPLPVSPFISVGRPYFVMELVRGVPITEFCDQRHLTPRERLELFVSVCHAIQHAHQKGIIHRDVKPTNVLVTLHDGVPVVKVIDFGVAKALSQQLTERTIYTQFAQMLGTPLYMSPEQAEMSGLDIDTRSDIYSLGVLLYELLTGTTPFDRERLKNAAALELRRILTEEEPPKPSTRLTQSGHRLATIAVQRNTEPAKLTKLIRGDLDWIVMKCLEKDRNRRYETANGLAHDIERYLQDEPVIARPPTTIYRIGKLARRNKVAFIAGLGAIVMLLVVVAGLAISNHLIAAERNKKDTALREKETALELAEAQRRRAEENFHRARIAVRGILTQAAMGVGEWAELTPSVRDKFTQETLNFYQSFLDQEASDPSLQYERAVAYRALSEVNKRLGKFDEAEKFTRQSITTLKALVGLQPQNFEYRKQLAWSYYVLATLERTSRYEKARASLEKAIGLYEALIRERPSDAECTLELLTCYADLVVVQHTQKASKQVEQIAARMMELAAKAPATSPSAPDVLAYAGGRLSKAGRAREAITTWCESIRLNPESATTYNQLAWYLATCDEHQLRDPERAVELASRAVEIVPLDGNIWNTLGVAQYAAGDWKAAIQSLNKSMELRQGGDSVDWLFLSMAECQLGNRDAARTWYDTAVKWMKKNNPANEELARFRAKAAALLGVRESESQARAEDGE